MEKQTFEIPKGCSKVTVEQIGNQVVTTFELENEFKRGDIITAERGIIILDKHNSRTLNLCFVKLYNEMFGGYIQFDSNYNWYNEEKRLSTDSEKKQLFDALAKKGKRWDAEKLKIVDLRYTPKPGDCVKIDFIGLVGFAHIKKILDNKVHCYVILDCDGLIQKDDWYDSEYKATQITPEELQVEFNKIGYEYDFETHEATKIKYTPKYGERYYYVSSLCEIINDVWLNYDVDNVQLKSGNCYRTTEDAEPRRQHYLAFKD